MAKAQVLVVTPPPLFPESRLQNGGGGGRNSGAVRYTENIPKLTFLGLSLLKLISWAPVPRHTLLENGNIRYRESDFTVA